MNKLYNNKGFSLVEIIVTIALMAIVTGATMSIYSWIRTQRIENLTENVSDSLNEVRTSCMSKDGNFFLEIKKDGEKYRAKIYKDLVLYKEYDLGKVGSIKVYDNSGNEFTISSAKWVRLRYDKSSGGIEYFRVCDTSGHVDGNCKIVLQYDNMQRVIEISKLTGKHFIE
ncbi:MAG: prepilin-type N-terminal cleavage/methylation domain-containing protein [Lachnospiraceae bacterium]|nr:prepilin-type N-terminal cleavage/methylation domain-containing protein [Lachnospiraceae bacterium]